MRQRRAVLTLFLGLLLIHSSAHGQWLLDGIAVSTAAGNQLYATLASDGAGGAIATWQDLRGGTYDIYAQRVSAAGVVQWPLDVGLCTAPNNRYSPMIVSDGVGGAIVVWQDFRNGTNHDIYAQRVDGAGSRLWTGDGIALCTADGNQFDPTIAPDGAGGALVAWYDRRSGSLDIYAQRVTATAGLLWTLDGVPVCVAANDQSFPTIVSDGSGGAIVAWYDRRSGTNDDIYARRVNSAGVAQWTADGVAVCTAANHQRDPAIVSDGAGGAIVTWSDGRSAANDDVYAQRVNSAGATQWTPDGVALSTAPGSQSYPTIVSDGASGAIVTWQDAQGTDFDVYAQRINAAGALQWKSNGVALSTAANDQLSPTIVADGAGGAIVTWQDARGADFDIYAQWINATGVVQWTPGGADLSTAGYDQLSPAIVSDGAAGAIVVWYDLRSNTDFDIYAQRVNALGFPPTGVGDVPEATSLTVFQNFPNPFSDATAFEVRLEASSDLVIDVYDIAGRRVSDTVLKGVKAGWREVGFDGRDAEGQMLPSGVYFYRVKAAGQTITRKMVIAR